VNPASSDMADSHRAATPTSHQGQHSLAIPLWLRLMILAMVTTTHKEANFEFSIAADPMTKDYWSTDPVG